MYNILYLFTEYEKRKNKRLFFFFLFTLPAALDTCLVPFIACIYTYRYGGRKYREKKQRYLNIFAIFAEAVSKHNL